MLAVVAAAAAAAVAGIAAIESLYSPDDPPLATTTASVQQRPVWAAGLDDATVSGWVRIREKFGFQDSTVGSAIKFMASNDRYSDGHPLHNLSVYPAQIERAFGLIARTEAAAPLDVGSLKDQLGANFLASETLPDQNQRSRGGQSGAEAFDDLVVFAAVEHLFTVRDDPRSGEIVRALRTGGITRP